MRMTAAELKIRQMTNQHLLEKAEMQTVVRDLCGIQAQFMRAAMHSLKIRCSDYDEARFSSPSGSGLVKNWTVRGTVHVFAEEDLPLFIRCGGTSYRSLDFGGYTFWNRRDVWALTPQRQRCFSEIIIDAVSARPYTRDELKTLCRQAGMTDDEESSMFDQWGGGIRELCERGFMNHTVQETKAFIAAPEFVPMPDEAAKLELAKRYFTNFAPATVHDAMYFFGARQAEVMQWLEKLPVEAIELDGRTYYGIPSGRSYDREIPPCVFLAGFDQLMLGYQKKESLYLKPGHLRGIFNLSGIVMPPVLLRGDVVGRWKLEKKNAALTVTLFEPLCADDRKTILDAAEALWNPLGAVTFVD